MVDPICCSMGIGGAIAGGAIYVQAERSAWWKLNAALDMFSDYLEEYVKENEHSRKKSHEIDYELRGRLEGVMKGMDKIVCPLFTAAKRTKVKGYLARFLQEDRNVELKDAKIIAKEFRQAVKGKSREINRQSTGGL